MPMTRARVVTSWRTSPRRIVGYGTTGRSISAQATAAPEAHDPGARSSGDGDLVRGARGLAAVAAHRLTGEDLSGRRSRGVGHGENNLVGSAVRVGVGRERTPGRGV